MAHTKAEISEHLIGKFGLEKNEAKNLVELFFEEIRRTLENGEPVKLSGFGNFELRDKCQRPGRNPKTGQEATISARRVVTFKAGLKLKTRINEQISRELEAGCDDSKSPGDGQ